MSVLVSHVTGNANSRAVLRALEARGLLHTFWTTLAIPSSLAKGRELGRRTFPEVAWQRSRSHPWREGARLLAQRLHLPWLVRREVGWASIDRVHRALDDRVACFLASRAAAEVRAVYAYEDSALATLRTARRLGLARIYELPIAHWRTLRRLLVEEADLHPAWVPTMEGLADSSAKLDRKDEEIELAERVVVASNFTRQSLQAHFGPGLPVEVIGYGAPPVRVERPGARLRDDPLRVLYAGHLNQRKGMAYLIAALERLDVPWQLTLAGPRPSPAPAALDRLLADPRCRWLGHVPHATLLEAMAEAHVFVFPSIVEGFGLVLLEAMAAGLPVITTPHTAGPDLIDQGVQGFVVPIRDPDAIATHLAALYADEPGRYAMAEAALDRARATTWQHYEARIAALVEAALG